VRSDPVGSGTAAAAAPMVRLPAAVPFLSVPQEGNGRLQDHHPSAP